MINKNNNKNKNKRNYNHVRIAGQVHSKKIRKSETTEGVPVAQFCIKIEEVVNNRNKSLFIMIVCFGRMAKDLDLRAAEYVNIEGTLMYNSWINKAGINVSKIKVCAKTIHRFSDMGEV